MDEDEDEDKDEDRVVYSHSSPEQSIKGGARREKKIRKGKGKSHGQI